MNSITQVNYLKRNLVDVLRQIDYVFKQLWGKVVLNGMHLNGSDLSNFEFWWQMTVLK